MPIWPNHLHWRRVHPSLVLHSRTVLWHEPLLSIRLHCSRSWGSPRHFPGCCLVGFSSASWNFIGSKNDSRRWINNSIKYQSENWLGIWRTLNGGCRLFLRRKYRVTLLNVHQEHGPFCILPLFARDAVELGDVLLERRPRHGHVRAVVLCPPRQVAFGIDGVYGVVEASVYGWNPENSSIYYSENNLIPMSKHPTMILGNRWIKRTRNILSGPILGGAWRACPWGSSVACPRTPESSERLRPCLRCTDHCKPSARSGTAGTSPCSVWPPSLTCPLVLETSLAETWLPIIDVNFSN